MRVAAVLLGLAVLAGTALVLARESLVPARESLVTVPGRRAGAGPDRAGPTGRIAPSLIGWTMAWSPEVRLPSHPPMHQTRRQS